MVLLSEAYLTALIPSYKKRICHYCLEDHQKRLTVCCSESPGRNSLLLHTLLDMQQSIQSSYRCVMMQNDAIRLGTVHLNANTHTGQVNPMPFQKAPPLQSPASSNSPSSFSPCHLPPPPTSRSVCAHTRHMVPHSLTCAVLKRFSSIKCDSSMESVVRMCLDAMALQLLNTQAGEHCASRCTRWDNADQ